MNAETERMGRLLVATVMLAASMALSPDRAGHAASPAPTVTSLVPATRSIAQGGTSALTLTISAAQATETTVALTSSAAEVAFVPAHVTVPAGLTSVAVPVTANTPGTAQITATLNQVSVTSAITVTPAAPTVISLLPPVNPVLVGATTTLTVTLSAAQPVESRVQVTIMPAELVSGPAVIAIPAGETTAPLPLTAVGLGTAHVTAALNSSQAEAVVRVTAPAPALLPLQPTPFALAHGATGALMLTLNAVQATDTTVTLSVD